MVPLRRQLSIELLIDRGVLTLCTPDPYPKGENPCNCESSSSVGALLGWAWGRLGCAVPTIATLTAYDTYLHHNTVNAQ